jgi:hypothetical protein
MASIKPYIFLAAYGLVVCQEYQYANIGDEVDTYLYKTYRTLRPERKRIVENIQKLPGVKMKSEDIQDFRYPEAHLPPILKDERITGVILSFLGAGSTGLLQDRGRYSFKNRPVILLEPGLQIASGELQR